jgi:hypothetical protein
MIKQKKGYLTVILLLLSGFAIARLLKKPKSKIIVSEPNKIPHSKKGSTVYKFDLITPIYTFNKEIELTILEQDENLPFTKISFLANNVLKTGWINDNNIINL